MSVTLVLLPGLDGTGILFAPFKAKISDSLAIQVVTYPNEHVRYDQHVEAVTAVLPKDRHYVLVAESYSGPVAVRIAARQPAGLIGVVLCATFVACPRPALAPFRSLLGIIPPWRVPAAWLAPILLGRFSTPALVHMLRKALEIVPPAKLLDRLDSVARVDVTEAASIVQVPTLYLRATSDRLVPKGAGDLAKHYMPGLRILELEGPHFLLQASAKVTADTIRAFSLEARAS
jgi:pimeloyl-ACP methyl ester carboxylesterase